MQLSQSFKINMYIGIYYARSLCASSDTTHGVKISVKLLRRFEVGPLFSLHFWNNANVGHSRCDGLIVRVIYAHSILSGLLHEMTRRETVGRYGSQWRNNL
jgi:hypothetical protein